MANKAITDKPRLRMLLPLVRFRGIDIPSLTRTRRSICRHSRQSTLDAGRVAGQVTSMLSSRGAMRIGRSHIRHRKEVA
jgi:hypothetical protein